MESNSIFVKNYKSGIDCSPLRLQNRLKHGFHVHRTSLLKVKLLLPKLINKPTSSLYAFR